MFTCEQARASANAKEFAQSKPLDTPVFLQLSAHCCPCFSKDLTCSKFLNCSNFVINFIFTFTALYNSYAREHIYIHTEARAHTHTHQSLLIFLLPTSATKVTYILTMSPSWSVTSGSLFRGVKWQMQLLTAMHVGKAIPARQQKAWKQSSLSHEELPLHMQ